MTAVRSITLGELWQLLHRTPAMVRAHPLSLAFCPDDVRVFETAENLLASLDSIDPQVETPMVALEISDDLTARLPAVRCDHDPFTTELNQILLPRLDFVQRWVLRQSLVPEFVREQAGADCLVLLIVDGLGYADWKRYAPGELLAETQPCFVDGISITEHGMRRIVGDPPIALRLAQQGYERSFGFSYWDPAENQLTDRLFSGVTEGVWKVRSFDEVLEALSKMPLDGTFVQIVRAGLDHLGHRHRDRPDIVATVQRVADEFLMLQRRVTKMGLSVAAFLTADHGILWVHEHELRLYEAGSGNVPPRHYEGMFAAGSVWRVEFDGIPYAALAYPFIRRTLKAMEWGVHGGLSFEEGFVPLVATQKEGEPR